MWEFLDDIGLKHLLEKLKDLLATKKQVQQIVDETNEYLLEIDYDAILGFNIDEIIGEEDLDIVLDENESLTSTKYGQILVDANNSYITVKSEGEYGG